jgi:2-keto-4-pentenoate hydratase/2-oxohepta-3-ene-1,7-dioic acid hydratase in catechol pathway
MLHLVRTRRPGASTTTHWVRFRHHDRVCFGTLADGEIAVHDGDMFGAARPTGQYLKAIDVTLLAPCKPSKIVALWNNFHALAAKLNSPEPPEPLYLLKAPSSVAAPGAVVKRPSSFDGRITYEGELGIVIGKHPGGEACSGIFADRADDFIFGYTCTNDITAADILNRDPTFPQWARAKSFDGFGPFGPVIAAGIDPSTLHVRTILNGVERQNYPVADMIFSPQQLVSLISHDMTLFPGDLICCGTSLGVGAMKDPVNKVTVAIDGIGELHNEFHH